MKYNQRPQPEQEARNPRNWKRIITVAGATGTSAAALFAGQAQAKVGNLSTSHESDRIAAVRGLASAETSSDKRPPIQEKTAQLVIQSMKRLGNFLEAVKHSNEPQEFFGAIVIRADKGKGINEYDAPYDSAHIKAGISGGIEGSYVDVITNPIVKKLYGKTWLYSYEYNAKPSADPYDDSIPNALVDDSAFAADIKGDLYIDKLTRSQLDSVDAMTARARFIDLDEALANGSLEVWGVPGTPPKMISTHSPDGKTLVQADPDHYSSNYPIAAYANSADNFGLGTTLGTPLGKLKYSTWLKMNGYAEVPDSFKLPF